MNNILDQLAVCMVGAEFLTVSLAMNNILDQLAVCMVGTEFLTENKAMLEIPKNRFQNDLKNIKIGFQNLLFGKNKQSPAFTVTNDQGTSETFGYLSKSTDNTLMREKPPTISGGSQAL